MLRLFFICKGNQKQTKFYCFHAFQDVTDILGKVSVQDFLDTKFGYISDKGLLMSSNC